MNDVFLDGNVMAGLLNDLFQLDVTTVQGKCRNCGDVSVLARSRVYGPPMGFVMRCRICDNVLAVLVDHASQRRLDMSGLGWIAVQS